MPVGNHLLNIIKMKIKKIVYLTAAISLLFNCKYDDSYLEPVYLKPRAYFASNISYERTVIPGEGLQFKIGAAMAGVAENKKDQTVDMIIVKHTQNISDTRILMPDDYYNSSELSGNIRATIPKGQFLGYFTVKLDSTKFLNDPNTMVGSNPLFALPVKIVGTSLDSISSERDSVLIAVRYQASSDGWYIYESTIEREFNGQMIQGRTTTESYRGESDAVAWRLTTEGPFTVRATSAVNAFTNGLAFNMTIGQDKTVSYSQVDNQPLVEPVAGKVNSYDSKTRDFQLNYKYVRPNNNDTIYHVSTKLIFRNRMVDGVMQTRDYLNYLNN